MNYVVLTHDREDVHPFPIVTGPFINREEAQTHLDLMNRSAPGMSIILTLIPPSPKVTRKRARPRRFGKGARASE